MSLKNKKRAVSLKKRGCPLFVYHARSAFHTASLQLCRIHSNAFLYTQPEPV